MSDLESFAETVKPGRRLHWLERSPHFAEIKAGWQKGITAAVIRRWLIEAKGIEDVPSLPAIENWLRTNVGKRGGA